MSKVKERYTLERRVTRNEHIGPQNRLQLPEIGGRIERFKLPVRE